MKGDSKEKERSDEKGSQRVCGAELQFPFPDFESNSEGNHTIPFTARKLFYANNETFDYSVQIFRFYGKSWAP